MRHPRVHLAPLVLPLLLLLGASIGPRPAEARGAEPNARTLFRQGVKAFKAGQYPIALQHFVASYKLKPKPLVIFNIAMCHRALFRYKLSIAAFRAYVKTMGGRVRKQKRELIALLIPQMESMLGRLRFHVDPLGADIKVDGELAGSAPLTSVVTVDPGKHVIEVAREGHKTHHQNLNVAYGQRVHLNIKLVKILQPGFVVISVPIVGALLSVDGGKPRPAPFSARLTEGPHKVRVTAPGHKPRTITMHVLAGRLVKERVELEPLPQLRLRPRRALLPPRRRPPPPRPITTKVTTPFYKTAWFWTIVGALLVGAGATAGYFIWQGAQPPDRTYDDNLQLR
ncbi:MAG: PEGA domain-containing protein [bacterium]